MNRRALLKASGIGLASTVGVAGMSGIAAAGGDADPRPYEKEGTLPNDNIETTQVDPLTGPGQNQLASTGSWLRHHLGWVGGCSSDPTILEATEYEFHIDGERIRDLDRFWQACGENKYEGVSGATWYFFTPPKEPGTYEFSVKITFTEDIGDIPEGMVWNLSEPYQVVAGQPNNQGNASRAGSRMSSRSNATTQDTPKPI